MDSVSQTPPALIPELSVRDWAQSRGFYTQIIGCDVLYERPNEGFSMLQLGRAQWMIDQIGLGRDFEKIEDHAPLGLGLNLQIEVQDIAPLHQRVIASKAPIFLPFEEKWYSVGGHEEGNLQFGVKDIDGYALRFFEALGQRP